MKSLSRTLLFLTVLAATQLNAQDLQPASNEFLVNQQIAGSQTMPHVASDEEGGYLIAWISGNELMARRFGPDHQALTDEFSLTTGTGQNPSTRVYYRGAGRYLVVLYSSSATTIREVAADNSVSEAHTMGVGTDFDLHVRGDVLLAAYSSDQHIRLRKWDLITNTWMGSSTQASEAPNSNYRYPQVRWTADGNIVAIYSSGSGTHRIYRKTFSATLLAQIPEEIVQTFNSGSLGVINISINVHDELLIYARLGVNGTDVFWGRVLDGDGNVLNSSVGNMSAPYAYYHTDCEIFDDGAVVLTNCTRNGLNDPEDYNVRALFGPSYGSPNTGWQVAPNTVSGEQRYPFVTKLPNNGFLIVWNGNGFQGDPDGVYARAFHATDYPALLATTPLPIVVDETGTSRPLGLRLATQPTGDVLVDLSISDPSEATIDHDQLTFTPANWDQAQLITVTGVDDEEDDGDIALHVLATIAATTADPNYAALTPKEFAVVNRDDDATFIMPGTQEFCRHEGLDDITFSVSNTGDPVGDPSAVSSDQGIVPDAAISVQQETGGMYSISIAPLPEQQPGSTTITVSLSDGSFVYSASLPVTSMATIPQISWTDMALHSSEATTYQWYLNGEAIPGAEEPTWVPENNGSYTVSISDANGCQANSAPFAFNSMGQADELATLVRIYPQPARDELVVEGMLAGATYRIMDAQGRIVLSGRISSARQRIGTAELTRGNYVIAMDHGATQVRRQVVIH